MRGGTLGKAMALSVCLAGAVFAPGAAARLVINEVVAANHESGTDPDFHESGDWVELLNIGDAPESLGAYALTDDLRDPTQWPLPDGASVAPGERLVIWLDGQDTVAEALHASFRLRAEGEALALTRVEDGSGADAVVFEDLAPDVALARVPDGEGDFTETLRPTPGKPNALLRRTPPPTIRVPPGRYPVPITVTVDAPRGAVVRHTTDGRLPDESSAPLKGPLTVESSTPLRVRAFLPDHAPSEVVTASIFIEPPTTLPILDLVLPLEDLHHPTEGIWANPTKRGMRWERPAHVTLIPADGRPASETDAGLRIHGGVARYLPKKTLRLHFRPEWGAETWSIPLLPDAPPRGVESLVLRAGASDSFHLLSPQEGTYLRDQLLRDLSASMGHRAAGGFFAALHINGAYQGLYNVCERIDEATLQATLGGSDWDIVKATMDFQTRLYTIECTEGDADEWDDLMAWIEETDFSDSEAFAALGERVDLINFIDHALLNIFAQNEEWPQNNWIAARRRGGRDRRWRWFMWDAEWGGGLFPRGHTSDSLRWALEPELYTQDGDRLPEPVLPRLMRAVIASEDGRALFLSRADAALNFALHPRETVPALEALAATVRPEISAELARLWHHEFDPDWEGSVAALQRFLEQRPDFLRGIITAHLDLSGSMEMIFTRAGDGCGRVAVNGRLVDLPWRGLAFHGSQVELAAVPDSGSRFVAWGVGVSSESHTVRFTSDPWRRGEMTVEFAPSAAPRTAPSVIFSEVWVNDNGTAYESLDGRAIHGDWFELTVTDPEGADLRGWRVTNSEHLEEMGLWDDGDGSLIFADHRALAAVPSGTCILILASRHPSNQDQFPGDDLDAGDGRMILSVMNGNLNVTADPGFSLRPGDEALALVAPGPTSLFADDIVVDFIAEGLRVTPALFGAGEDIAFGPPFEGTGDDDGAVFVGAGSNDSGFDPDGGDDRPGPGGWIVDPSALFTGDEVGGVNILTPGAPNPGSPAP